MKYFIITSLFFLSFCSKSNLPREYRKMQNRVHKNEIRSYRDSVLYSLDTINTKWFYISDSTLIGVPRILK